MEWVPIFWDSPTLVLLCCHSRLRLCRVMGVNDLTC